MVRQAQKEGQAKAASPEVARVASSIKKSDAKDFASTKHKGLPEKKMEKVNEEGYDHYKDNILMRGGDHRSSETKNKSYTPSGKQPKGKTVLQKQAEKKYGKGKSALDMVKMDIRKKYGKGAIMGEENLEEKKKGLWANIHAKRKRGEKPAKKGDKDYPETLNVESMVANHRSLHKKKQDETGGLPRQVAAKNRRGQMQGVDEALYTGPNKEDRKQIKKLDNPNYAKKLADYEKNMSPEKRQALRDKATKGMKFTHEEAMSEAKYEKGASNYGKASIRNKRMFGKGGNAAPPEERGAAIDVRRARHQERRYVKKGNKYHEPGKYRPEVHGVNKPEQEKKGKNIKEDLRQAKINVGRDPNKKTCWKGYKATGTKMKGGKQVPDCKKEDTQYEGVMKFVKRAARGGKPGKPAKKTTGRDAGAIAAKIMRDKENKKYVSFLPANEGTSYGLYKGSGKASGAMKDFLDKKAKKLEKQRASQSQAARNNPHFDSTQPSPSGRNKYEHVSFKSYFTEGNKTARMLHKSKTSVTGNISADRGGDEKKNKESRKGLEKDLKKKGIGFTKGVGKYKYDSGETGTEVSYQTSKPDKMSKRRFGKTMRRLGRKHGQESVVTKDKNKPARLHDTESKKPGKSINIGKSKPGSNPSGQGETSGNKVRGKTLPKKQNKGAYHYGK